MIVISVECFVLIVICFLNGLIIFKQCCIVIIINIKVVYKVVIWVKNYKILYSLFFWNWSGSIFSVIV